jgi:hypothetical protein
MHHDVTNSVGALSQRRVTMHRTTCIECVSMTRGQMEFVMFYLMEVLSDVGLQKGIHCPSDFTQFAFSSSLVPTRTLSCLTLKLEELSGFHPFHYRN